MKDDDFEPSPIVDDMGKVELESACLEFLIYVEFKEAPMIEIPRFILTFEEALTREFSGYIIEFEEAKRLYIELCVEYTSGSIRGAEVRIDLY